MEKPSTGKRHRGSRRARRAAAEWVEEVNAWRSSGQSAAVYAQARGLHPATLAVWASRVRKQATGEQTRKAKTDPPMFLPVRVVSRESRGESMSTGSVKGEFEVLLTNGRRVRIAGSFEPQSLARLPAAVEGGGAC
jgi:hypothetical protein